MSKYRNLALRKFRDRAVIYYERVLEGERVRFSTYTDDWDQAAEVRDLWEARRTTRIEEVPTFAEAAARYLAEGTHHLAPSSNHRGTRSVRTSTAGMHSSSRTAMRTWSWG